MADEPLNSNPIVALAMKIRGRRDIGGAIDSLARADAAAAAAPIDASDVVHGLQALGEALQVGCKRLNSILGKDGVRFIRLERPLRLRLRFGEKRISLDADEGRQLVIVRGLHLDGEYQFDTGSAVPALINLSKLSTEAGYGDALTSSSLLKTIAQDAVLPRPPHLDAAGPLQF